MGIIDINVSVTARRKDATRVAGAVLVHEDDMVMLITNKGQVIKCPVTNIREVSRNTTGVRIMNVDPDEVVVSVARIVDEDEEEAIEEGMEAESIDSEPEEEVSGASDTSEDAVDEAEESSEESSGGITGVFQCCHRIAPCTERVPRISFHAMKIVDRIRTVVFLGSGAAVFALIGATALVFWWSPMSPLSRDEPALLVSAGDMDGASQAYLQQSVGWGTDAEREEAMWRAAMLEAVELNHRRKAIRLLTEFQEDWPDSAHQTEAYLLLAKLYEPGPEEDLTRAHRHERLRKTAQSLELAILSDTNHDQAGEWLVRIAGIWWSGRFDASGCHLASGDGL